jgi:signal transduction histidine kinase
MEILLVEDNPEDYAIVKSALVGFDYGVGKVIHAKNLDEAKEQILSDDFDVILFDLGLPDSTIQETVDFLTHLNTDAPIVVLSSLNDLGIAKELLRNQIQDYIPKDEISPSFLNRVCTYAIERKLQQVKLEQRNEDMRAFCSMLSHDFKGSVRRIGHIASFLQEDLTERVELTDKESKFFQSIQRNTTSIQSMVDSLLEYLTVSYTSLSFEKIDTNELLESIEYDLKEKQEKAFVLTSDAELVSLYGHRSLLIPMFLNLFNNSIKYNDNKPEITFSISEVAGNRLEITIQDNGIGIEQKSHKDIFQPFRRLFSQEEYSGTGLGLSVVKIIVELHKGKIKVTSEPGAGTTLKITLPNAN